MCGLSGMWNKTPSVVSLEMMKTLIALSSFRGDQSTGLITIEKDGSFNTVKSTLTPFEAIKDDMYLERMLADEVSVMMAHTRAATHGAISTKNSHPFTSGSIIGMHNGTIRNGIPQRYMVTGGTDSEALYNMIAEEGLVEALKKVKWGAYALQMYDFSHDNKVIFIRNEDRPLWFGFGDGCTVWHSEKAAIEFAAARHKKNFELVELPVYEKWTLNPATGEIVKENLTDEVGKSVTFFPRENQWKTGGSATGTTGIGKTRGTIEVNKEGEKKTKKDEETSGSNGWVNLSRLLWISLSSYIRMRDDGCHWCGADFKKDTGGSVFFEGGQPLFVCDDCSTNELSLFELKRFYPDWEKRKYDLNKGRIQ